VHAGVEACDDGPANGGHPAFLLTQGDLARPVAPIARAESVAAFYDYHSASSHTGFEAARASRLYLYRDEQSGALGLVVHHGIDAIGAGEQPKSEVAMAFTGLPGSTTIAVSDDEDELTQTSPSTALGAWKFHDNTDGGAFSGLPLPGAWTIDVDPDFEQGIDTWAYVDADGSLVALEPSTPAHLTAFADPGACRTDCTIPRCGDGLLDGGELCDDGNTVDGDGCPADCR
jgi:cysteine-rich repeat protein